MHPQYQQQQAQPMLQATPHNLMVGKESYMPDKKQMMMKCLCDMQDQVHELQCKIAFLKSQLCE